LNKILRFAQTLDVAKFVRIIIKMCLYFETFPKSDFLHQYMY